MIQLKISSSMKIITNLIFIFLLFQFSFSFAQSRKDLESQREKTIQEIKFTNKLLSKTTKTKKSQINKLYLVRRKIQLREKLINNINSEIVKLDTVIKLNENVIFSLNNDLTKLKEEYARLIYNAYKNRSSFQRLSFVLSSNSFNQAYKRVKYLQQYSAYRKKQAKLIDVTKSVLEYKNTELLEQKADKLKMLENKNYELENLESEIEVKNGLIQDLKKKERKLRKKLREQQKAAKRLEKEINKIIEEDLKKSGGDGFYKLTPEEKLVATNFEKNRGRLPWPMERGIVIQEFGEYWHPVLKGVKMDNSGIDIETSENALVRTVFSGEVKKVFLIPGSNAAVIIRHGSYLTVYSNLTDVRVKPGEMVNTKDVIGKAFTDKADGNKTVLHFEVLKEMKRLNPQFWLSNN